MSENGNKNENGGSGAAAKQKRFPRRRYPAKTAPEAAQPENSRPQLPEESRPDIVDAILSLGKVLEPRQRTTTVQAQNEPAQEAPNADTAQNGHAKRPSRRRGRSSAAKNQAAQAAQASESGSVFVENKAVAPESLQKQKVVQHNAAQNRHPQQRKKKNLVRIIPLGGLGEVGKNITVYECGNDAFIVDCGLTFPDESMPGVDLVIPDFTYVLEIKDRLRGIVITHGHEDHIGALAYLLKSINVPVYATRLTTGLIEGKLKEHGLLDKAKLNTVKPGDTVTLGCMSAEFINVNHSIPDSCAIAITTPAGVIIQTGDFKVDFTPIKGDVIDLARFGELGGNGVLALLSDSTNAERPGSTASERTVGESFDKLFAAHEKKRIIVASFASNVHRIQQIMDAAVKYKRKVAVSGRSMENVVNKALEMGYLEIPSGVLVEMDSVGKYPSDKMVIITTGSQGEPMSALTRMAMGDHRKVNVTPGDCIIISATPIPGNEKLVTKVINELLKLGADVVYEKMYEIHVSGHACQDELKMMMALTRPNFFIPMHGEYKHLKKHAELARSMGIASENILLGSIGRIIETDGKTMKLGGMVSAGNVLVDGLGVGDVGSIVLRDRKHLAQDGLIIVVAAIEAETGQLLTGPDIVSRGFVYVRESEDMIGRVRDIARNCILKCLDNNTREWGVIKQRVKDDVGDYIWQVTKRSPMILPIVQEV